MIPEERSIFFVTSNKHTTEIAVHIINPTNRVLLEFLCATVSNERPF